MNLCGHPQPPGAIDPAGDSPRREESSKNRRTREKKRTKKATRAKETHASAPPGVGDDSDGDSSPDRIARTMKFQRCATAAYWVKKPIEIDVGLLALEHVQQFGHIELAWV
jgi:hypothetical protein